MDLFLDLPSIAQDLAAACGFRENMDDCLTRLATISAALRAWRRDWDRAHEGLVRKVWRAAGVPPGLEFDSPRLALDILYYDAAMVYLMQIEAAAQMMSLALSRGVVAVSQHMQPDRLLPTRDDETAQPTRRVFSRENPQYQEQGQSNKPAAEALVAIACILQSLPTIRGHETVVTPAPIGIIYSMLQNDTQMHALVQLVEGEFEDAQDIFGVYQASPLDAVLREVSRSAPEVEESDGFHTVIS